MIETLNKMSDKQKKNEIMKILICLYDIFEDENENYEGGLYEFKKTFYRYRNYWKEIERNYERNRNRLRQIDMQHKELEEKIKDLEEENKDLKQVIKRMIKE